MSIQERFECLVNKLVESGNKKGDRVSTTDSQGKAVIKRQKGECFICRDLHASNTYKFVIHHIDGNPKNTYTDNLVLVCANCHSTVHGEADTIFRDFKNGGKPVIRKFESIKKSKPLNEKSVETGFTVKCNFCKGFGKDIFTGQICPICEGDGEIVVYSQKKCVVCKGFGKDIFTGQICPICEGTGHKKPKN